jgi:hypothetical protein
VQAYHCCQEHSKESGLRGVPRMELITIEEFLDSHLKNNPSEKRTKEDLRVKLKKQLKQKPMEQYV